jgi:hypothetical protein
VRAEVTEAGSDAQSLALEDASCDGALSPITLCVIPDVARACRVAPRRAARGHFQFLEHRIPPDDRVAAARQKHLEPWQMRFADGCHLTRDPAVSSPRRGSRSWSSRALCRRARALDLVHGGSP